MAPDDGGNVAELSNYSSQRRRCQSEPRDRYPSHALLTVKLSLESAPASLRQPCPDPFRPRRLKVKRLFLCTPLRGHLP